MLSMAAKIHAVIYELCKDNFQSGPYLLREYESLASPMQQKYPERVNHNGRHSTCRRAP